MSVRLAAAALASVLASGCGKSDAPRERPVQVEPGPPTHDVPAPSTIPDDLPTVDAALLRRHISELASDAYAGRRPGTPGADATVEYLTKQFGALGLLPAGEDDTYLQTVPMRGVTPDAERSTAAFVVTGGKGKAKTPITLRPMEDITLGSYREAGTNHFDAELVFVGYGVTAPEEKWDDYDDSVDVTGKVVVAFVGDPPGDDHFGGAAMTYYGRWTYKFERALEAGAAGCLVIHEAEPASYGWNVVRSSWSGERFHLVERGGALPDALQVQGWLHADAAARLAELAGSSLDAWHEAALDPEFRSHPTGIHLRGEVVTREREMSDRNVIGVIPGSEAPDETVFVTAHWDHLGTKAGAAPGEDTIFNGAIDNASGIAGLLATATALQQHRADGRLLRHSIVFLATTAEEQGLLGSRYYANHPLVDLSKALAAINLDSMNVWGETTTITVVGPGHSDLEDSLGQVAVAQGRTMVPDEHASAGSYYRSDHFAFAQRGVPALFFHGGPTMAAGGEAEGARLAKLRSERYHTVDDEYDPSWPLAGAVQDVEALTRLILLIDAAPDPPHWKPTSEFASVAR